MSHQHFKFPSRKLATASCSATKNIPCEISWNASTARTKDLVVPHFSFGARIRVRGKKGHV